LPVTDCHIHVIDPAFEMVSPRSYTPLPVRVEDVRSMMLAGGIARVVIVQISVYGNNNGAMMAALDELKSAARGVIHLSGTETEDDLRAYHARGVRGVRVNLWSTSQSDPAAARRRLQRTAEICAPLGWHVQLFADLAVLSDLADDLPALPVPVVLDHYALLPATPRAAEERTVLRLRESGRVWIKLSADYRLAGRKDFDALTRLARDLDAACPETTLWGSDFPHPPAHAGQPTDQPPSAPYRQIDTAGLLPRFRQMFPGTEDQGRILEQNPARLYQW